MKEKDIESTVSKWASKNGLLHQKLLGEKGMPDRIFYTPGGKPVLVEFKKPNQSARKLQKYYHDRLMKLGFCVQLFDNVEDTVEFITNKMDGC